jgi:hypothetical protein
MYMGRIGLALGFALLVGLGGVAQARTECNCNCGPGTPGSTPIAVQCQCPDAVTTGTSLCPESSGVTCAPKRCRVHAGVLRCSHQVVCGVRRS